MLATPLPWSLASLLLLQATLAAPAAPAAPTAPLPVALPPPPPGPPPELAARYDQSQVPLELEAPSKKLKKIVLVAGKASHGPGHHEYFAGMTLLAKLLGQEKGVHPVIVRDGWPKNPAILDGAASIVFFADGGKGHPLLAGDHLEVLQKHIDAGVGFACLHYAVNYPAEVSDRIVSWLGGHYHPATSSSPATTWVADFKTLPKHPIARGLVPYAFKDEWYFNMRFVDGMKGVTPILSAVPPETARTSADAKQHPGRAEITAWAYERPGRPADKAAGRKAGRAGRSFGYTGGHYHDNWAEEPMRRLIVNALLWTARVEVPKAGAKVAVEPTDLQRALDWKPPKPKR
jgi:hypothetical protein